MTVNPHDRNQIVFVFLLLIGALAFGPAAFPQSARNQRSSPRITNRRPAEPPKMRLRVEDDRVTGEIRNTPLLQVLEELAAWTGIIFEVGSDENAPVWLSLFGIPLEEAIQRIVGDRNSIVYCDEDQSGHSQIHLVRIFARNEKKQPSSLRYIGSGTKTKNAENALDTPDQALLVLSESDDLEARQKAVEILADADVEIAIPALMKALEDPAPEIKVAAIENLAGLGARDALPQILKTLEHAHPGVRQSAVMAVALLGDSENVKDLRSLVRDKDASVAAAAEVAVRKLEGQRP